MLSILQDTESEGYYQRLVATVPNDTIFEALSHVRRAVHDGKLRKFRGALFVAIVKRACANRGIPMNRMTQPYMAGQVPDYRVPSERNPDYARLRTHDCTILATRLRQRAQIARPAAGRRWRRCVTLQSRNF